MEARRPVREKVLNSARPNPSASVQGQGAYAGLALLAVVLLALALVPHLVEKFYVQFFAKLLIMGIFAMSLDLLLGYTGLVSFGHAAFYGVAGYALALLTPALDRWPQTTWLIDAPVAWGGVFALLPEAILYVVLLAGAAMVDFYRRNF